MNKGLLLMMAMTKKKTQCPKESIIVLNNSNQKVKAKMKRLDSRIKLVQVRKCRKHT